MKKEIINSIIDRYNLGGKIDTVKFEIENKKLKTSLVSDEKNVVGTVKASSVDIEDCVIGIFETAGLKKILSVLDEEITVSVNKKDSGEVSSLNIKDSSGTKANFVAATLDVIPKVPDLQNEPEYQTSIKLTEEFISKFIKAQKAVDSLNFTLQKEKDQINIILGYSENNTNRISFNVETINDEDDLSTTISFSAIYFREILLANMDCVSDASLNVSNDGLAKVEFKNSTYETVYYLVKA